MISEAAMERGKRRCNEWMMVKDMLMYTSDLPLGLLVPSFLLRPPLLEADPTPPSPLTLSEVSHDCFLARGCRDVGWWSPYSPQAVGIEMKNGDCLLRFLGGGASRGPDRQELKEQEKGYEQPQKL